MMAARLRLTVLAETLTILGSACGGGASPPSAPSPSSISILMTSLPDGMVTFDYTQTIRASGGVAPFIWNVNSGTLPHALNLQDSSTSSATISGTADTAQTAGFTIKVTDAKNQIAIQSYTVNIKNLVSAQLQEVQDQVPAGAIEIRAINAGPFNPLSWQRGTLNWVPDVRTPMFASLAGHFRMFTLHGHLSKQMGGACFMGAGTELLPLMTECTVSQLLTF